MSSHNKVCTKCKVEKDLAKFHKSKRVRRDGKSRYCKECKATLDKVSYSINIEKRRLNCRNWYGKNKEHAKEYRKEYGKKYLAARRQYEKERRKSNPIFQLKCLCRARLSKALKSKNFTKFNSTQEMLGCTFQELKAHIEKQFTEGMTWEKVGPEIHIDHVMPLASAKTKEQLIGLFHYTNLQPLWAKDNLSKGAKQNETRVK